MVLTAVVVTQVSVGGSLRATLDYVVGFALDQLFQNAGDLARRIEEYSTGRAA
jgi:hypothetical protein